LPSKTKCLESSKRKRKASEGASNVELHATSGLAALSRKKSKKAVKKVAIIQRVALVFSDDEAEGEPRQSGYFPCFCCMLRWGLHSVCTPGSETGFVDIETFSNALPEARTISEDPIIVASFEVEATKILIATGEASQKFTEELEHILDRSGGFLEDPPLIGNCEYIPETQDPSPEIVAYNTSFGTSFRGELLSVECPVVDDIGGVHSFSVLW
jgi:hypothetical protein